MTNGQGYYRIQVAVATRLRGDYVICEVLEWTGTAQHLAKIRIVRSTLPTYRVGKIGLVQRDRLEPVRRTAAGGAAA